MISTAEKMSNACFVSASAFKINTAPNTTTSSTITPRKVTPTCTARSSRKPKRKPPSNSRSRRPRSSSDKSKPYAVNDPLLNDNDIDTTDITTFVSCPVCFNSLMIRPQQLFQAPLLVKCNCCGKATEANLEKLENLDGDFDYKQWIIEHNSRQMSNDDIEELQQFSNDLSSTIPVSDDSANTN